MKDWSSLIALEIFKDVSPVRISWALFEWKEKVITSEIPLDTKVFLSLDIVLNFLSLIGYAILTQKLIKLITANPKTINTISASVLVIIACIIVVTQQY